LNRLLLALVVLALPAVVLAILQAVGNPRYWLAVGSFAGLYVMIVGLAFLRRIPTEVRAWGLLLIGYAAGVVTMMRGGLAGDGRLYLLAMPIVAALLAGPRSGIVMTALCLVTYGVFALLAHTGNLVDWLIIFDNPLSLQLWIDSGTDLAMLAVPIVIVIVYFTRFQSRTIKTEQETVERLAHTTRLLQERAQELEEANRLLVERTKAMTATAEVARQIAALSDEEILIEQFVHLVSRRFGLRHVALFTLDSLGEFAILNKTVTENGRPPLEYSERVRVGAEEPVGQAAATGEVQISVVDLTTADAAWPHWRIVIPSHVGDRVLSVLDVHFVEEKAPTEEQIQALQTLADQLAVGLEKVRLFVQTRENLEELRRLNQLMSREAWQQFVDAQSEPGVYRLGAEEVTDKTWASLFKVARESSQPVHVSPTGEGDAKGYTLVVPVKLRGLPIGTVGFHRPAESGEWQPEEIALAERAADRLALALETTRLLEETRRRAVREHVTSAVASRMREALDVEAVLRTAANEIRTVMNLPSVTIRLAAGSEDEV
jgi:K+-sensing histidine kinase KdpD